MPKNWIKNVYYSRPNLYICKMFTSNVRFLVREKKLKLIPNSFIISDAQQFQCPNDKTGQYTHPTQCDKYYVCHDGVATENLCPDGLVFDPTIRLKYKCDQPFNVDCGDRTELQSPKSTNEKCPRKHGFFAHPDPQVCNVFYNCIDGDAIEITCTNGLHFDEFSGTCVWPLSANREGCKSAEGKTMQTVLLKAPLLTNLSVLA